MSCGSAWSVERAPDQSGLLSEILSQNIKIKRSETKRKEKRKGPSLTIAPEADQTGPCEEAEAGSSVQGQLGLCVMSRTARAMERACPKKRRSEKNETATENP